VPNRPLPRRRHRAGALLALAAAALLLGACVFGGGDDAPKPTATPEVSATTGPTSAPTGEATPIGTSGELPSGLEPSAPDTWKRVDGLRSGDEVPDVLGALIFDTVDGTATLWSLDPDSVVDPQFVLVEASVSGNYVIARGSPGHLVNTNTGTSFTWPTNTRLHLIEDEGAALFASANGCRFWAVDLSGAAPALIAGFDLLEAGSCPDVVARFSPDHVELLVVTQGNNVDGGADLFVIDLESGEPAHVASIEPPFVTATHRVGDGSVVLTAPLPGAAWVGEYVWAERGLATVSISTRPSTNPPQAKVPPPSLVTVSPDARWIAWSDSDDLGARQGLGGQAEWPVVVIASIEEGGIAVRAQRVALTSGAVSFDWLSDSSALVVQSEDGFALLGTDGGFRELPFPVASHFDPVPMPAPDRTGRFAYDGRVVDAVRRDIGEPPPVTEAWGAVRWSEDGDRLLFVREAEAGGDFGRGGVAQVGLPARIVTGPPSPYAEPVQLSVASDGDHLNVRAAPGINEERLGQFDHGTLVTVTHDASINLCGAPGCSILSDPDLDSGVAWWIYVRDDDGLEGWVSAEFVEWAN